MNKYVARYLSAMRNAWPDAMGKAPQPKPPALADVLWSSTREQLLPNATRKYLSPLGGEAVSKGEKR
jgi:hypothetical protein